MASTSSPGSTQNRAPIVFNQGRGFNDVVNSIVMVPDESGDVFVGGAFTDYDGTLANHLIRLHSNGAVTQTFGTGFDRPVSVVAPARDGSGDLYALGDFTVFNGQTVSHVARLNPDGSLDTGFRPSLTLGFEPSKILPADDGSADLYVISVGPSPGLPGAGIDPTGPLQVIRLNSDGTVDPAFAAATFAAGTQVTSLVPAPGTAKVYVGGSGVVRLNPDGTVDPTFKTRPEILNFIYGNIATIEALAPARDGTQDLYTGGRRGRRCSPSDSMGPAWSIPPLCRSSQ